MAAILADTKRSTPVLSPRQAHQCCHQEKRTSAVTKRSAPVLSPREAHQCCHQEKRTSAVTKRSAPVLSPRESHQCCHQEKRTSAVTREGSEGSSFSRCAVSSDRTLFVKRYWCLSPYLLCRHSLLIERY